MLKKYIAFSIAILLLTTLGVTCFDHLINDQQLATASSSHSVQETHHDNHASKSKIKSDISWQAYLPLILVLLPLFASCLIPLFYHSQQIRDYITVGATVVTLFIILAMFGPVVQGITHHGHLYKGIFLSLPLFPDFDATFRVDPAALLIAGVTVFVWMLAAIYSLSYMTNEGKRPRYEIFKLITLTMNLGVLMAGDFLTLFFFFEGMLLFSYPLLAHRENKGAMAGSKIYLYLGIATGLCLFFGILLLQQFTGSVNIGAIDPEISTQIPARIKYLIAGLMIFGFGGKAGIFMEHFWMPEGYPDSPAPTPVMSSGAMIKVGAYGIFRVVNMIFAPSGWGLSLEWITTRHIGYAVIWIGVITMFMGVLNALISSNSKRMLAYHSVSQMGYIIMGIGCAAYMGSDGAMGLAGSLYHILNHALFKASLFLTVGAIYFRAREVDMYKLGGLWRNMPFTCVAMFIAVCGISGIPGFNGFASKTLLHHSILEAYEHSAHYAANGLPDFKLKIAEIIFMITAGGTFASNMKLWVLSFLGKRPEKYENVRPAPTSMKVAFGLVSTVIVFIGLFPNWMLEQIIGPALSYFHFNPSSHAYHTLYNVNIPGGIRSTIPILYNPFNHAFFSDSGALHNLLGSGDAVILGGIIFIIGIRFHWFHTNMPTWLTVRYYYFAIYHLFKRLCHDVFTRLDAFYNRVWMNAIFGHSISETILKTVAAPELWDIVTKLENRFSEAVDKVIYSQSMRLAVGNIGGETVLPEEEQLNEKERSIWQEFMRLDEKYDEAFEKAIFSRGVKALIDSGKEEGAVWQELKQLEKKYGGEVFDKMIVNKGVHTLISDKTKKKPILDIISRLWGKFVEFDKMTYDPSVDMFLFGNIDPSAKPQENQFYKFCRNISNVHTGDVSQYISWIIFFLVLMVSVMIGGQYITSFLSFILLITLIIILTMIAIFFPSK